MCTALQERLGAIGQRLHLLDLGGVDRTGFHGVCSRVCVGGRQDSCLWSEAASKGFLGLWRQWPRYWGSRGAPSATYCTAGPGTVWVGRV